MSLVATLLTGSPCTELTQRMTPELSHDGTVKLARAHHLGATEDAAILQHFEPLDIRRDGKRMRMSVVNSGNGLDLERGELPRRGVGLANVRDRLRLHYGERGSLSVREMGSGRVNVTIALPLQLEQNGTQEAARFDV